MAQPLLKGSIEIGGRDIVVECAVERDVLLRMLGIIRERWPNAIIVNDATVPNASMASPLYGSRTWFIYENPEVHGLIYREGVVAAADALFFSIIVGVDTITFVVGDEDSAGDLLARELQASLTQP